MREARAAVCHRFGETWAVEGVVLDPPAEQEVRIRVLACAVCHSDVAYGDGAWGGRLPAVFGHEACGVVEECGAAVESLTGGQTVVVGLVRHCGRCGRCVAGEPALCTTRFRLDDMSPIRLADGRRASQGLRCGAFAEQIVVHHSQAVPVPADFPPASASVIGCAVMTGLGAADRTPQLAPGATVAVIGAGGVGLNAIQGAALAGAAAVVAIDVSETKLRAATTFGATHVVDATAADPVAELMALTGGEGADAVIATAGSPAAIEQGLAGVRRGGTLVVVGMPPTGQPASFDAAQLAHDGKRIVGSKLGGAQPQLDVPRICALYRSGRLLLDELVTGTFPLDRIDEAVSSMRRGEAIRNVVTF
jgi:S-(hydroxymethyl)glutathione dehydrogenase/alcohol dehydrogenase